MTDNTQAEVERYHPSYCDKYEVLRGIYPNDRRLTGKDCSCGFEQALLDWHNKRELEARIDTLEYAKISPKFKIEEKIEQLRLELEKYE